MVRSKKPLALLLTCSVSCAAALSCSDDEDGIGGSAGSGGTGGKSTAGSSNAGTAGRSTAGSSSGGSSGTAGSGAAGGTAGSAATAGTAGTASAGTDAGGAAGEGGTASGGDGGATTDGGMGGTGDMGGAGGEGGEPDVGPHQTPRLEYRFDENTGTVVGDSSGRDLDATLSQAAWTADGRNGSAMKLAGGLPPAQYATVPAGIFDGAKATTVAAWVKLDANPIWARLFDFGNGKADPANRFMYVALDSNLGGKTGVRFVYYGGSPTSEPTVATGTVLPLNVWKHLAVTMAEDGEQAIYIDGFPAAKAENTPVPLSGLEPLVADSWLGKSRFPTDAGFQGAMDDFLVYDRVLPPDEIADLANPKSDYTRLPFDEGQGTTSEDVSDRAADAVLIGGATWATGRLGAGVQLSGTSQYVALTNPMAGCTTELSISLWVKHLEAKPWSRVFDFGTALTHFIYLTPTNENGAVRVSLMVPNVAETVLIGTKPIPVENAWHHVAVVVTSDLARLYIDGEAAGNATNLVPPSALSTSTDSWLGHSRFPADINQDFKGAFDEVRIMCRAITPDEVKNLAFKD